TPDDRADRHDPPHLPPARRAAAASRAAVELGESRAPRRNVPALLRRQLRGGGDRVRLARSGLGDPPGRASLAPAVAADRRAGRLASTGPPPHAAPRGTAPP